MIFHLHSVRSLLLRSYFDFGFILRNGLATCVANCLSFLLAFCKSCWQLVHLTVSRNSSISYMTWQLVDHLNSRKAKAFEHPWVYLCLRCSSLSFSCCLWRISCCLSRLFGWNRWGWNEAASSITICSFAVLFCWNLISSVWSSFLLRRLMGFVWGCLNSFWPFFHIRSTPWSAQVLGHTHDQGQSRKLVSHRERQFALVLLFICNLRVPTVRIHLSPKSKVYLTESGLQLDLLWRSGNQEYLIYSRFWPYEECRIRRKCLFPKQRAADQLTRRLRMNQHGFESSERRKAPPAKSESVSL